MNKYFRGIHGINKYTLFNGPSYFHFSKAFISNKPLTMRDKMKMIKEKEEKNLQENKEEITKKENKLTPAVLKLQKMRGVIYVVIPFLIWTNPLSILYSKLILFSNYYLIFLTSLEASAFFSLGLNEHSLEVIAHLNRQLKSAVSRKRLMLMVVFFAFLILSAFLASQFKNSPSLGLIATLNLYLFVKFSYHITLYNLDKVIFNQKLKNLSMNIILSLLILMINIKKTKEINNNILY
jgi:hypothetical protein